MAQSRWTTVHGLAVHSRYEGRSRSAPPLVLVHGLGVSSRYLMPAMQALSSEFSVHAPDLPGTGRSGRPAHTLDIPELAGALLEWLDATGLERVSFLGNSMGCQVIVELAKSAPRRVDKLVLVGATVDPAWRSLGKQAPRWLMDSVREPPQLLPILVSDYLTFGTARFLETGQFALADRMEDKLPFVEAPTLVVRGEHDAFVSDAWNERMAALLPQGRSATIPHGAHAVHFAEPEALAALVRPFLMGEKDRFAGEDGSQFQTPSTRTSGK